MSYINIVICIGHLYIGARRGRWGTDKKQAKFTTTFTFDTHLVWLIYLRVHPTPYSPDPKSFILDICRVNPRQCLIYLWRVRKYFWTIAQFFIKSFEVVRLRKNCQAYFYATCSSLPSQKNNTLRRKKFTRRTMQSAIWLFVFEFSWDGGIFARTICQGNDT
jgi:hypothetical protein